VVPLPYSTSDAQVFGQTCEPSIGRIDTKHPGRNDDGEIRDSVAGPRVVRLDVVDVRGHETLWHGRSHAGELGTMEAASQMIRKSNHARRGARRNPCSERRVVKLASNPVGTRGAVVGVCADFN